MKLNPALWREINKFNLWHKQDSIVDSNFILSGLFFHSPKAIEILGFHLESQEKNYVNPVNPVQIQK
jgi:hypothetical protein